MNSNKMKPNIHCALYEAVKAIYFDDGSDYLPALWSVVRSLSPDIAQRLETSPGDALRQVEADLMSCAVVDESTEQEMLHLRDLLGKANALARLRAFEIERLKVAATLSLNALEMIVADVKTTPNAYEAQRQAIASLKEFV